MVISFMYFNILTS